MEPEDLLRHIHDKHLRDISGVLRVQGDRLDRSYIEHWAVQLGVADTWRAMEAREKGV